MKTANTNTNTITDSIQRPTYEVKLNAVVAEETAVTRYTAGTTDALVSIPGGLQHDDFAKFSFPQEGYLIYCNNTREAWCVPSRDSLDANFIYRADLQIIEYAGMDALESAYKSVKMDTVNPKIIPKRACYILDNPITETYEVYYDSKYPLIKYGYATPKGMIVTKFSDRFDRDLRILELDTLYSTQSLLAARNMLKSQANSQEAIIISDGSFMHNSCASSFWYLSAEEVVHTTTGYTPSDFTQAVVISEIRGAIAALKLCMSNHKKRIRYYYDNVTVYRALDGTKLKDLPELVEYRALVNGMLAKGFDIRYIELHPKVSEEKIEENKALMFFHNLCDRDCKDMTQIVSERYVAVARSDKKPGVSPRIRKGRSPMSPRMCKENTSQRVSASGRG